jgi:hypothetical protein
VGPSVSIGPRDRIGTLRPSSGSVGPPVAERPGGRRLGPLPLALLGAAIVAVALFLWLRGRGPAPSAGPGAPAVAIADLLAEAERLDTEDRDLSALSKALEALEHSPAEPRAQAIVTRILDEAYRESVAARREAESAGAAATGAVYRAADEREDEAVRHLTAGRREEAFAAFQESRQLFAVAAAEGRGAPPPVAAN